MTAPSIAPGASPTTYRIGDARRVARGRTRGGYQSPLIERLDVVLGSGESGEVRTWYAAVEGYGEGYLYALVTTYEDALAEFSGRDAQLEVRGGDGDRS